MSSELGAMRTWCFALSGVLFLSVGAMAQDKEKFAQAQQQNKEALKQYTWKSRTELKMKGESRVHSRISPQKWDRFHPRDSTDRLEAGELQSVAGERERRQIRFHPPPPSVSVVGLPAESLPQQPPEMGSLPSPRDHGSRGS